MEKINLGAILLPGRTELEQRFEAAVEVLRAESTGLVGIVNLLHPPGSP